MEPLGGHKVTNPLRNAAVRILVIGVVVALLRFMYVISTTASFQDGAGFSCDSGDFCFLSASRKLNLDQPSHSSATAEQFTVDAAVRKLWTSKEWRRGIHAYSSFFQNLTREGLLSAASKTLVVAAGDGEEAAAQQVLALKEIGVADSVGVGKKPSRPLVLSGDPFRRLPFEEGTFDLVFAGQGGIDSRPKDAAVFAREIGRTLRPGGIAVIHALAVKDTYSLNSLLGLFNCCRALRSSQSGSFTEFILKKHILLDGHSGVGNVAPGDINSNNNSSICSVPPWKKEFVQKAEPLIMEEPLKPWLTLKRNIKNIRYLSSMVHIAYKRRYIYVDVGARSYGSSIGGWFRKQYPMQNRTFEVFAIEADHAFHEEYGKKKGVQLLPYAAWLRNETLLFEVNGGGGANGEKGRGMGRIQPVGEQTGKEGESKEVMKVQGFDFAEWLMGTVSEGDFVVMKMDVEGAEFDLIPRLIETGAICLIDEIFLECHYNRWQRSSPERTKKLQCGGIQRLDRTTSRWMAAA
ncbi:hypothetical protein EJ110_NYTH02362 [Nymphaea thermarum]|nr:hypothetical protein EJ110_NYTH02362 [Nymphaea thermarum]